MIDAVYPLLKAGPELRYSVRSVLRHGENVGDIVIIGDKPKFFAAGSYFHIAFADAAGKRYENVWRKLRMIALNARVSERFLFMNDDFYIQRAFDAATVPNYGRGDLKSVAGSTDYQKMLRRTLDALVERGMTTLHFGTHQPVNFEKAKVLATFAEFKPEIPSGISFRCCYMNMHKEQRTSGGAVLTKDFKEAPKGWAFASAPVSNLKMLDKQLSRLYPRRSILEV